MYFKNIYKLTNSNAIRIHLHNISMRASSRYVGNFEIFGASSRYVGNFDIYESLLKICWKL
jgi:hypothetical protein